MKKIKIVAFNPSTNREIFKVFQTESELTAWSQNNPEWSLQKFDDWKKEKHEHYLALIAEISS